MIFDLFYKFVAVDDIVLVQIVVEESLVALPELLLQ